MRTIMMSKSSCYQFSDKGEDVPRMELIQDEYTKQLPSLFSKISKIPKVLNPILLNPASSSTILKFQYLKTDDLRIDFLIDYDVNYQSPVLYFHTFIISTVQDDGIEMESWKLVHSKELVDSLADQNHNHFQISMKAQPQTQVPYWFVHPCDTNQHLSPILDKNKILLHWFGLYAGWLVSFVSAEFYA